MTLTSALKATERSLILGSLRVSHRVGSVLAPERTARAIARRFFATTRSSRERQQFNGLQPRLQVMAMADGEVATYQFGSVGHRPTVLLAHGWNGWAQQMEAFVEPLIERGFAVVAFDHVAHGASDGTHTSLPAMIRTTERFLTQTPHVVGAVAHSLGAAALAGALASARIELTGAALIAPPSDPRPYLRGMARMLGASDAMLAKVQAYAEEFAGVKFERLVMHPWMARRIRTPLLVAHDVDDREVPIAQGYAYAGGTNARLIATDGLGHTRILRDRHIVESVVGFVARRQAQQVALAA